MKNWMGLLVLSLAFSSSAFAMSPLSVEHQDLLVGQELMGGGAARDESTAGVDYFAEVEKLFAEGTVPAQSDVLGWYSGRCYFASARGTAKSGLLAGFTELVGGDNGPLFPATEVLKFLAGTSNRGPDAYDNLSPEDEAEVVKYVESEKDGVDAAVIMDNSLSLKKVGQLRKVQNYLVLKSITDTGRIFAYCYYFKKIK